MAVGSTEFNNLIRELDSDEFFKLLLQYNFTELIFQIGHGKHEPKQRKVIGGLNV